MLLCGANHHPSLDSTNQVNPASRTRMVDCIAALPYPRIVSAPLSRPERQTTEYASDSQSGIGKRSLVER